MNPAHRWNIPIWDLSCWEKSFSGLLDRALDEFAKAHIFAPLGMNNSLFNPPGFLRPRIAPTEYDAAFRKRLLRGEVHDENAWAMGGISGNAGLFSTARDIAAFAQMLLNGGIYAHHRLLARATIQRVHAATVDQRLRRTLGWDVPTPAKLFPGHYFSADQLRAHGFHRNFAVD